MEQSEYFSNLVNFFFIAVDFGEAKASSIIDVAYTMRILNVCIITYRGGLVDMFNYEPFGSRANYWLNRAKEFSTNADLVFPDKLKNLNGYKFTILLWDSPPRIFAVYGRINSPEYGFMFEIAKLRNARVQPATQRRSLKSGDVVKAMRSGNFDVCINTEMFFNDSSLIKSVITFDTDGYCAMVPLPKRNPTYEFLFTPFDKWTWILILASTICGAVVWQLLGTSSEASSSGFYFIFGVYSYFIGQSTSFHQHTPMQKMLLQLVILLAFILGSAYESLLIASLSDSRVYKKITLVDELVTGNYSFYVNENFANQMVDSEFYQQIKPRVAAKRLTKEEKINFEQLARDNFVIIEPCSMIDFVLKGLKHDLKHEEKPIAFYYKLDQPFNFYYLNFPVATNSFFHQHLQRMSYLLFESGVRKYWMQKRPHENLENLQKRLYYENEEYLLNIVDLSPAFYILITGLILSTIVFLFEIFTHGFLQHLQWKKVFKFWSRKKSSAKGRARFIQVVPKA